MSVKNSTHAEMGLAAPQWRHWVCANWAAHFGHVASVAKQHPKVMQICRRALPKQTEEVRKVLEGVIKQ